MSEVKQKPSLALVRKFKAPPEKVWCALTQPDALAENVLIWPESRRHFFVDDGYLD